MGSLVGQFASVLTALAVLAVSATCTSAGCLLPLLQVNTTSQRHACCADNSQSNSNRSHDEHPKHCPTCYQPITNCTGDIHKAGGIAPAELVATPFTPILHLQSSPLTIAPALAAIFTPAVGPPTLVQLHCALLN